MITLRRSTPGITVLSAGLNLPKYDLSEHVADPAYQDHTIPFRICPRLTEGESDNGEAPSAVETAMVACWDQHWYDDMNALWTSINSQVISDGLGEGRCVDLNIKCFPTMGGIPMPMEDWYRACQKGTLTFMEKNPSVGMLKNGRYLGPAGGINLLISEGLDIRNRLQDRLFIRTTTRLLEIKGKDKANWEAIGAIKTALRAAFRMGK
jgi:hypothetical protein